MKKSLFLLLIVGFFVFNSSKAQCPLTVAVDFTAETIYGDTIHLFDILDNGQYVVIDFFFTTCGPCQQTAPIVNQSYNDFGCNYGDVFFMSISTGDNNAACILFDETYGVEYPTISGVEGGGTQINNTYQIGAYPTVILIAPNYDIIEQDIWPIPNVNALNTPILNAGCQMMECPCTAQFTVDNWDVCAGNSIQFFDESIGNIISWEWEFEGGDPSTSTEQNPLVSYEYPGDKDVTLTVTTSSNSNTFYGLDIILIYPLPEVTLEPFDDVCIFDPPFELTGGLPEGGEYFGAGVTNGWFDPNAAGLGTHTITYTYTDTNECENFAEEAILVDACTGIDKNFNTDPFSIYPNPSDGNFNVEFTKSGHLTIRVVNILGVTIYEKQFDSNGKFVQKISLKGIEDGLYFVIFETGDTNYVKKLKVRSR